MDSKELYEVATTQQKPPKDSGITSAVALALTRLDPESDLTKIISIRGNKLDQESKWIYRPQDGRDAYVDIIQLLADILVNLSKVSVEEQINGIHQHDLNDIENIFIDVASMAEFFLLKMEKRDA